MVDISRFSYLFEPYEQLVKEADIAFQEIKDKYPECVSCEIHCADCCYAVFGIFFIEALFLKNDFERLDQDKKEEALVRAKVADKELTRIQKRLKEFKGDPYMINYILAKERIRCPLLSEDNECILYPYRPITCRVYGVPVLIRGNVRVCHKSGFEKGKTYTTYNMDRTYKELYSISRELLSISGEKDMGRASLMISVAKAISTPIEQIVKGVPLLGGDDKDS